MSDGWTVEPAGGRVSGSRGVILYKDSVKQYFPPWKPWRTDRQQTMRGRCRAVCRKFLDSRASNKRDGLAGGSQRLISVRPDRFVRCESAGRAGTFVRCAGNPQKEKTVLQRGEIAAFAGIQRSGAPDMRSPGFFARNRHYARCILGCFCKNEYNCVRSNPQDSITARR